MRPQLESDVAEPWEIDTRFPDDIANIRPQLASDMAGDLYGMGYEYSYSPEDRD